jgi:cobalt-zinc-cadmium efflux system protein
VIVGFILWSTWGLLRHSLDLALDAAPEHIDVSAVRAALAALPGVAAVHDLHVWAIAPSEAALTAHLVRPEGSDDAFLAQAGADLQARFAITHVTLQVERVAPEACAMGDCS